MATRYDVAGLRQLARSAGLAGSDVDVAAAVAMAESGGNPTAVSSTGDYGLWQINTRWWPQFTRQELFDPAYNARAMAVVSKSGRGWNHWTTYRNGAYKKFMTAGAATAGAGGGLPGVGDVVDTVTGLIPGADQAGDLVGGIAGGWVKDLLAGGASLLLSLLLAAAGLAIVGIGLARLTSQSKTGQTALQAGGMAAAVATSPVAAAL